MSKQADDNRLTASKFPRIDYDTWRRRVETELDETDFAQALVTKTAEDIEVQPLYTANTAQHSAPFALLDRSASRPWVTCQAYRTPDLDRLASQVRDDLRGGVEGVSLRFDRSLRVPNTVGGSEKRPVGDGVTVETTEDLERVFGGEEHLPKLWMVDAGAHALPFGELALKWIKEQSREFASAQLCLGVDPLGTFARDGVEQIDPDRAEEEVVSAVVFEATNESRIRPLGVSTMPYVDGGADAVSELAFALSTAVQYLSWLDAAGRLADQSGDLFVFRLGLGKDIFLEVAKLRAFRQLWSRVLGACGTDLSSRCWIHAETSARILTGRDLSTNLLRVTNATFAAIVGGADSISSPAYDSTQAESASRGRRLARNTQNILRQESYLGRVSDPGAGSYYLESLGGSLAQDAWQLFQQLEQRGGILEGLRSGTIQSKVQESWLNRRHRFSDRRDPITGMSFFADPTETAKPTEAPLHRPGKSGTEAAKRGVAIAAQRDSRDYEIIRNLADQVTEDLGHRPSVFLATLPSASLAREPVSFARNFFRAGGFLIGDKNTGSGVATMDRVESLVDIWQHLGSEIFCICSAIEHDRSEIVRMAREARSQGARAVVSIELTPIEEPNTADSGIDLRIHPGIDAVATLRDLLDRCTTESKLKVE